MIDLEEHRIKRQKQIDIMKSVSSFEKVEMFIYVNDVCVGSEILPGEVFRRLDYQAMRGVIHRLALPNFKDGDKIKIVLEEAK